ncbi:Ser/Thr protein phosphatase [Alcanivorax sp. P2S70]|uniref:metallophosphoesterase n=1 Tax=Alcanivorax TaxID=59753 RepID=UPI0003B57CFA|nr:metallophosphoesterase [Alcanivorax sp. P2S70]ERP92163.1 Ser/Thr protein phosphatase [Alcanivorax sp. P2S70]|tara:strand:- start:595 stop:1542 length:948 start_codon:yes stop_codon:yes gene_type:complete
MRRWLSYAALFVAIAFTAAGLGWWFHTPHGPWLVHDRPLAGQRVCAIGDGGWGNPASLAVGQALVTLGCDQIRYLGDLVYPDGILDANDPLIDSRFLPPLQPALDAGIPVYMVLGNHDWKQNGEAWLEVARHHPLIHLPHFYYFEQWPDACAFSLETTWFEKWYYFHRQINWLTASQQMAHAHGCQFSLGFAHHPMFSTGSHGNAHEMINLGLKQKLIGHLDLLVGGHDHILSDEGEYQDTRQLISGSASITNDLGPASNAQHFTRATHGLITLDFEKTDAGLRVDYRFYSVLGNPQDPLITLLWQGDQNGQGIR